MNNRTFKLSRIQNAKKIFKHANLLVGCSLFYRVFDKKIFFRFYIQSKKLNRGRLAIKQDKSNVVIYKILYQKITKYAKVKNLNV